MTRLSVLIGIAMMLVGALAYALPSHPESWALVPATAGVLIALLGVVAMRFDTFRPHMMHLNCLLVLFVLAFSAWHVAPLSATSRWTSIPMVANLDLTVLSAIFLYYAFKSFLSARFSQAPEVPKDPQRQTSSPQPDKV